jgi:hypothetical protein
MLLLEYDRLETIIIISSINLIQNLFKEYLVHKQGLKSAKLSLQFMKTLTKVIVI